MYRDKAAHRRATATPTPASGTEFPTADPTANSPQPSPRVGDSPT
jgi:hypothetical protein